MKWIVVLVTLSAAHPCQPGNDTPTPPSCRDHTERMGTTSLAQCEGDVLWWRRHAREIEAEWTKDRFTAVCIEEPTKHD